MRSMPSRPRLVSAWPRTRSRASPKSAPSSIALNVFVVIRGWLPVARIQSPIHCSLLPPPYASDALEPHIDARTMEIHHDKHHQAYVDNANKALDGTEWADRPVENVLAELEVMPEAIRTAVRNNAGGHANHSLFWTIMGPDGGGERSEEHTSELQSHSDLVCRLL